VSNLSKLTIAVAACGGILFSLNHWIPRGASEVAARVTGFWSPSTAVNQDTRPEVVRVADTESNTTEVFTSMRAALATARSRARELTSYTATLEMQEEVHGKLRGMEIIHVKLRLE
jgi:hypothetical protein